MSSAGRAQQLRSGRRGRGHALSPGIPELAYPERLENTRFAPLDFASVGALTFEDYDRDVFPCLGYAYEAARRGGTWPAALNAANEVAVERFLAGEIRFVEIADLIDGISSPGASATRIASSR